jgi:hypothetical protein
VNRAVRSLKTGKNVLGSGLSDDFFQIWLRPSREGLVPHRVPNPRLLTLALQKLPLFQAVGTGEIWFELLPQKSPGTLLIAVQVSSLVVRSNSDMHQRRNLPGSPSKQHRF